MYATAPAMSTVHSASGMPFRTFKGFFSVANFPQRFTFTALLMAKPRLEIGQRQNPRRLHVSKFQMPSAKRTVMNLFPRLKKTSLQTQSRGSDVGDVGCHHAHIHTTLDAISNWPFTDQQTTPSFRRAHCLITQHADLGSGQRWGRRRANLSRHWNRAGKKTMDPDQGLFGASG